MAHLICFFGKIVAALLLVYVILFVLYRALKPSIDPSAANARMPSPGSR